MKRWGVKTVLVLAFLLSLGSFVSYQHNTARLRMEEALHLGDYSRALLTVSDLRKSILLLLLRWGTPFFLKNVAGEMSFVEAEAWYSLGEKRKAQQAYLTAAELFNDSHLSLRASAYYNSSVVMLEMQNYLQARELLHKALDPVRGNPYHLLAKANLERLEILAAETDLFKDAEAAKKKPLFDERQPLDPWSKSPEGEKKPGQRRR